LIPLQATAALNIAAETSMIQHIIRLSTNFPSVRC
jgi:hypothetical protein